MRGGGGPKRNGKLMNEILDPRVAAARREQGPREAKAPTTRTTA